MTESTVCNVKNRSASVVVYRIADDNIRREFAPGETKKITYGELIKLSFQPGGRELMEDYLFITEAEATQNLNVRREPEYEMDEAEIKELIAHGSIEAFLDCLDFAPTGIIDLIKRFAVSMPMNDMYKAEALKNKTGFDLEAALKNLKADQEPEDGPFVEGNKPAAAAKPAVQSGRRTTATYKTKTPAPATTEAAAPADSKYKVVSK